MEIKKNGGWRILWVWVVLAFIGLTVAWYCLISIASKNAPEKVPLVEVER
ncbi:hypothetical protein MLD52_11940 [Puniceicoccaceae bacterium K14]|nr:hypothetical protein [Puniceicoccaceae bacterium K14]